VAKMVINLLRIPVSIFVSPVLLSPHAASNIALVCNRLSCCQKKMSSKEESDFFNADYIRLAVVTTVSWNLFRAMSSITTIVLQNSRGFTMEMVSDQEALAVLKSRRFVEASSTTKYEVKDFIKLIEITSNIRTFIMEDNESKENSSVINPLKTTNGK
jgi:hypothetical protein